MRCKISQDAMQITSRAKNLPPDLTGTGPRLVMYTDRRAKARFRAYQLIAKTMRDESGQTIQTNIRTGKTDFLLRARKKGDDTPWSQVPPIKITQKLPAFEEGLYKDIKDMSLSSSEEEYDGMDEEGGEDDDNEELHRIQRDIEKTTKEDKKNATERQMKTTSKTKSPQDHPK